MRNIWSFQPMIIDKKEPPKLPESEDELRELLEKFPRLILEKQGELARFGTSSECSVLLKCPFCKSTFTGYHEEGCFHSNTVPFLCPVCNYPSNVREKYMALLAVKVAKQEPWKFEANFTVKVKPNEHSLPKET